MNRPPIPDIRKVQINYEEIPIKNKLRSRSIYSCNISRKYNTNDFKSNMVRADH